MQVGLLQALCEHWHVCKSKFLVLVSSSSVDTLLFECNALHYVNTGNNTHCIPNLAQSPAPGCTGQPAVLADYCLCLAKVTRELLGSHTEQTTPLCWVVFVREDRLLAQLAALLVDRW